MECRMMSSSQASRARGDRLWRLLRQVGKGSGFLGHVPCVVWSQFKTARPWRLAKFGKGCSTSGIMTAAEKFADRRW